MTRTGWQAGLRSGQWLWAAVLACGCAGGGEGPDSGAQIVVSEEAVDVLATPDIVTRVADVQPASDGRTWVLNSVSPFFVVLGPTGAVERRFGRQGGGPEEFGQPVALVRGPDGVGIWTYDVRRHAMIRISGAERRELVLSRGSLPVASLVSFKGAGVTPAPLWLASTPEGIAVARSRVPRPESALHLWSAEILLLSDSASTGTGDPFLPVADLVGDPVTRYGDASILLPYPLWDLCPDGTVGLYDPIANVVGRVTAGGDMLGSTDLPAESPVAMTEDLVLEMFYRQLAENAPSSQIPTLEEMRRLTEEQNREFVQNSAPTFPQYSDLRCAGDGELWLLRFDPEVGRLGRGSDWLRIAADGSQEWIALPRSFRTSRIEGGRIWGTIRDSLGVESIASVPLDGIRRDP